MLEAFSNLGGTSQDQGFFVCFFKKMIQEAECETKWTGQTPETVKPVQRLF